MPRSNAVVISATACQEHKLFPAMTMSTLRLWELASLAAPLLVILAAQAVLTAVYAAAVVYRVMSRDYEAVAMAAGF